MKILHWIPAFVLSCCLQAAISQTPTDAIMMTNGQICLFAVYSNDSWDEYWEGTLLRENGNIGTFTRQTITPGFALGLGDYVNVIAMLPWTSAKASGGQLKGVNSLQDWGLWFKALPVDAAVGNAAFTIHAVAGLTGPSANYLEDYAPFSPGLGCLDLSGRAIMQYKLNSGPYLRAQAGYHLRGNAKIERDYYYTTHGVYSDEVDMPNAVTYGITLGTWLINHSLKIEGVYDGLNTLGGFDMRRQDAGFPSNKMIFTRIGGGFQYYPLGPGLGVLASYGKVLTGRNVGKSSMFSAGLTYQFGLWNKGEEEIIEN